jgi:hypothetical protein
MRIIAAIIIASTQVSLAATLFVAPTGDDANDGSGARPFLTITHALLQAGAADTVRVLPGVYHEAVRTVANGAMPAGFHLLGAGVSATIIDGTGVDANDALHILHSNVVVSGFTFRNWHSGAGITLDSSVTNTDVSDCLVDSCYWGVSVLDGCTYFRFTRVEAKNYGAAGGFGFDVTSHWGVPISNGIFTDCIAHDGGGDNCDGFALGHDAIGHHGNSYEAFRDVRNIQFIHCTTYNVGDGFDLSGANIICQRCLAHNTYYGGNFKVWASNVILQNCVAYSGPSNVEFDKYSDTAVGVTPPPSALINQCTLVNGLSYNINLQSDSSTWMMTNTIVAGGTNIGINMEANEYRQGMYTGDHNLFHCANAERMFASPDTNISLDDFLHGGWTQYTQQDSHSVTVPDVSSLFRDTNSAAPNYRLKSGAAAINAGFGGSLEDFDGRARSDGQPDIGAFEYGSLGVGADPKQIIPFNVVCTPTVVNDEMELSFQLAGHARLTVFVFDAAGRAVMIRECVASDGSNAITLHTASMPSGEYQVLIAGGDKRATARFVVNR